MRKGFDGLAALVQQRLRQDPFGGAVYAFRGKRGNLVKLLWWDGQGLVLHAKRLEHGRFHLARDRGRRGGADARAAVDALGRGGLAAPDPVVEADASMVRTAVLRRFRVC